MPMEQLDIFPCPKQLLVVLQSARWTLSGTLENWMVALEKGVRFYWEYTEA